MAVPKKRTSKAKKNARKANWKRKSYHAAQKSLTDVAKLVDALDLGPSNFCFESSSLSIRNSFYTKSIYISNFYLLKITICFLLPFNNYEF